MKKLGQFEYKDHDMMICADITPNNFEWLVIVVNQDDEEWDTGECMTLGEAINLAIDYVDNAPNNRMRP